MADEVCADDRLEKLILKAAGVHGWMKDINTVTMTMKLVGFTDEEVMNRTLQQRIRRLSNKMGANPPSAVKTGGSGQSLVSDLSTPANLRISETSSTSTISSSKWNTHQVQRDEAQDKPSSRVEDLQGVVSTLNSAFASTETAAEAGSTVSVAPPRKKTRRTPHQLQEYHAAIQRERANEKQALKAITTMVHESRAQYPDPKDKRRIPVAAAVAVVNETRGSNVNVITARRYIKNGRINESPSRPGPVGKFPMDVKKALLGAYGSYLSLQQAHGNNQATQKDMARRLESCLLQAGYKVNGRYYARLFDKELAESYTIDKHNVQEKRRAEWTTYQNLNVWFDMWRDFVVDKGFARLATDDEKNGGLDVVFHNGQDRRVINIDETDLSLDRTDGKATGRRPAVRNDRTLPTGNEVKNKSSDRATLLTGSNAAGEPIPPHVQFKSSAQAANQRVDISGWTHMRYVKGRFGYDQLQRFLPTVAMNEKGGMNAEALFDYFKNNLLRLYPDAQDVPLKRVVIKIDSGPGRMNESMLAFMRTRGYYLFPGVPNTTQVTQETDQNYESFKRAYRVNLDDLCKYRFAQGQGQKNTVNMSDIWLLVFGGAVSPNLSLSNAFEAAFSTDRILWAWNKVGACPLTRACLLSSSVRHEVVVDANGCVDVDVDPVATQLLALEEKNKMCCQVLQAMGCAVKHLTITAPRTGKKVAPQRNTEELTAELQEQLAAASSAGEHFKLRGGTLSADDYFIGKERTRRKEAIASLQAKKARVEEFTRLATEAATIMESNKVAEKGPSGLTNDCLKKLIKWKQFYSKQPSRMPPRKQEMLELYNQHPLPAAEEEWTEENQQELETLQSSAVDITHTMVGQEHSKNVQLIVGGIQSGNVPASSIEALEQALDALKRKRNAPANESLPTKDTTD